MVEQEAPPRGRVGRAISEWRSQLDAPDAATGGGMGTGTDPIASGIWQHIVVGRGIELQLHHDHPLVRRGVRFAEIAAAVRDALEHLADV
jgi:hypothetical protein